MRSAAMMELSRGTLLILSMNTLSLQFIWSLIFSQGTEHLLRQGLSRTAIALVWLFPPCSGMVVPPLCKNFNRQGEFKTTLRWLICASICAAMALCTFGWCSELASIHWSGRPTDDNLSHSKTTNILSQAIAVASLIVISIAIQPVQYGSRLLAISVTPRHQQAELNSYYGYMNALGGVLANMAISETIQSMKDNTMSMFASITALILLSTCTITVLKIQGMTVQESMTGSSDRSSFTMFCRRLHSSKTTSFKVLRRIFFIQFCGWAAWFSFLYNFSSFSISGSVRNVSAKEGLGQPLNDQSHALYIVSKLDWVRVMAARHASMALAVFYGLSLICYAILPKIVPYEHARYSTGEKLIPKNLKRLWITCQAMFAILLMISKPLNDLDLSMLIAAYAALPWTMTQWTPYVIVGWLVHEDKPAGKTNLDISSIIAAMNISITAPQIIMALVNWLAVLICTHIGIQEVESVLFYIAAIPMWLCVFMILKLK